MAQIRTTVQRDQKRRKKVVGKAPYGQYGTRPPVFKFYSPASLWQNSQNSPIDERNERLPESQRVFEMGNVINLPVDSELEANAKKWALSKNRDRRWVAARALLYFKSDGGKHGTCWPLGVSKFPRWSFARQLRRRKTRKEKVSKVSGA